MKPDITITISGTTFTPKWSTLEKSIREAMDDEKLYFYRIARPDHGANYRISGEYEIGARSARGDLSISLCVS